MINVYEDLMIDSSEDIVDNLINMFNKYVKFYINRFSPCPIYFPEKGMVFWVSKNL